MSVRVYQLAKKLGIEAKHVVQLLKERGLNVSSPSNTIPSIYADALIEEIGDKKLVFKDEDKKISEKEVIVTKSPESDVPLQDAAVMKPQKMEEVSLESEIQQSPAVNFVEESSEEPKTEPEEVIIANESSQAHLSQPEEEPVALPKPPAKPENIPAPEQKISKTEPKAPEKEKKVKFAEKKKYPSFPSTFSKKENHAGAKRPVVVSITANTRTQTQNSQVKTPAKPKTDKPKEQVASAETVKKAPAFRPFLKKIERPSVRPEDMRVVEVRLPIVVRSLATLMDIKPFQLISKLMSMNIFASMNQELEPAIAESVAEKFGCKLNIIKPEPAKAPKSKASPKKTAPTYSNGEKLVERAPIVCVLGHVDHGKTTLLDTIRHAKVAAGEAGGITQHVAAYQVDQNGKKITFIDTPGHAAFSKMRERGANITDIGVLIVAADDGFMPQTDEALKFARKAGIPIVVAINKMDAKGANIDRVKQQMQQRGILPEEWGGETLCQAISALNGTHVENLLELINLQAEIMELKADPSGKPEGVILESKVATGVGATASAIIQDGTLKVGDCIICGPCYCKVKSLINDQGKAIKEAPVSTPVNIVGWSDIPEVGAKFTYVANEKIARKEAEQNALEAKKEKERGRGQDEAITNLDDLLKAIASEGDKELNIIVRTDVHGSAEALYDCLSAIHSKKIRLNIIDCDVGAVTKNDVILASTSSNGSAPAKGSEEAPKTQIVAFNTKVESSAQALAKQLGIKIISHNIIYEIVDKVREAMAECLDPELKENKLGAAEVRQMFKVKNEIIAGCMVTEGKLLRDKFVRVIRKKEVIFQGKFASIKHLKEDVGEIRAGFECGISISGFDDEDVGDIIECFEIQKIQPSL